MNDNHIADERKSDPFADWELIRVKNLAELVDALDRADRKGYMPDAVADSWEAFQYVTVDAAPIAPRADAYTAVANSSAWFSVAMNAAAYLEDAANCLTDPDAKQAAKGAAAHTRKRTNELWVAAGASNERADAEKDAALTDDERKQLDGIVRCDPSWLLMDIRENSAFDANVVEKVFELAKQQARAILAAKEKK